ncbi:MAG TPA: MFS transporter [Solirubrobacterales bacterium]|nr:MFS transporter [Solirubrobacterales bacterium]
MDSRKKAILLAISIPLIMVGIDGTILNVALPTIATDLDTTSSELVWINSAYIITFGSTILLSASIGDKFGRKRVLQLGCSSSSSARPCPASPTSWTAPAS